ncbi:hypothetical protein PR048_001236 [Dryococelus australis]|uniref:Uncharacterized protein n=1 Tax=Dryococelus australis TaxID=614101 RepID=A0ABQ9IHS5_9NEOP|nr:hypothetical protein PR048_001236 [Dryococelus australis]
MFDIFGTVQLLYNFIEGSPTRHAIFEQISKSVETKLRTLKSLSTSRWACTAEVVAAVSQNFPAVVKTISHVIENNTFPEQLVSFEFFVGIGFTHPILQVIVKVSKLHQDPKLDIFTAVGEVRHLRSSVQAMRSDCEENEVQVPSSTRRKKDEIRTKVYYPILDSLVQGIDEQFSQETIAIVTVAGNMFKLDITKGEIAILYEEF